MNGVGVFILSHLSVQLQIASHITWSVLFYLYSGGGATNRTKSSGYTNRSALSLGLGNNQGVIRDDDSR
jgi:hypothetical protein